MLPRSCTEAHARCSRIPTICTDPREEETVEQGQRLRAGVTLVRRQADPQGMASLIDGEGNLATEASATAAKGVLPPFFGAPAAHGCARTSVLSTSQCSGSGSSATAVNRRSHTPAGKVAREPCEDAVPRPLCSREQVPLCATAAHPFHRCHEAAACLLVSVHRGVGILPQAIPDLVQSSRLESDSCHAAMLPLTLKRQQNLTNKSPTACNHP